MTYQHGTCPACGSNTDITCGEVIELRNMQRVVNEHKAYCHGCGHEFDYDTGKPLRAKASSSTTRSAAIAASWTDKKVAQARAARHRVRVTDPRGGQGNYNSVREAFITLALPLGQHIRFRATLKAAGQAHFGAYQFKLLG